MLDNCGRTYSDAESGCHVVQSATGEALVRLRRYYYTLALFML